MHTGEHDARRLNERLVQRLEHTGAVRDRIVAGAFRAVLRHHFLPGRPLDEVYEDAAITTKTGHLGTAISSSSQPAIMATMLEQLQPRRGDRVLEVGAGTGYNAALMAWIVGPSGSVTSLDIDEDLCAQADANLAVGAAPGGAPVRVVRADGAGGWPEAAPFDRIVVTAGADDLAPAWLDQLVEGGRLVLPLRLAGPAQQCAAFVRYGRSLVSGRLVACGFVPLRGTMAAGGPSRQAPPWLGEHGRPTGHRVPGEDLRNGFETWLLLTRNDGVRVRLRPDDPSVFGLAAPEGAALVVGDGEDHRVAVFGDGDAAAARLAVAHKHWTRDARALDRLQIAAYPAGEEPELPQQVRVVRRPHFTFVVTES